MFFYVTLAFGRTVPKEGRFPTKDNQIVRQLRHRFVRTAMISLLLILIVLIGVINIANFIQIDRQAAGMLHILQDNGGTFPEMNIDAPTLPSAESSNEESTTAGSSDALPAAPPTYPGFDETHRLEAPYETRYYSVTLDASGNVTKTDTTHIAAVSQQQAQDQARSIFQEKKSSGYLYTYKFSLSSQEDGSWLAVFVDCSSSFASAFTLFRYSLLVGAAALCLMFLLVWVFSGRAVAPVVESLEKQKRFISDAGHELKTPISIISANVDVLEMTGTQNKWTQSIRHQTKRMTDLVNNLLTLSRMEEGGFHQLFEDVDFSKMVQETCATYETVAQARHKELRTSIQGGIHVQGEPKSLQQLVTLLLDNAMKYADEGGRIDVRLSREKNRRFCLEVSNTCDQMPEGDLNRLFDRFYRADTARKHPQGSTGGFGIGLSVARAICTNHGGTIEAVRKEEHVISFVTRLPASTTGPQDR